MGRRDYRHREQKKAKKDSRKVSAPAIVPPPTIVEVIKRGKKSKEDEEFQ